MKLFTTLSILLLTIAFCSCEKVIKVDLKDADKKYVIEANIDNTPLSDLVKISRTKKFSDNTSFEMVTNATVVITDDAGNSETLNQTSPGNYTATSLVGTPGRTYYLTVKIDGNTYTATSYMPPPVALDTIFSEVFTGFGDTINLLHATYQDPVNVKNFYRHVLYINNKVNKGIYAGNDDLSDGKYSDFMIFNEDVKKNDSIRIEMQCIDEAAYTYFSTLAQMIDQSSAAPTNPISNMKGGALGYFSAHTTQTRRMKVTP